MFLMKNKVSPLNLKIASIAYNMIIFRECFFTVYSLFSVRNLIHTNTQKQRVKDLRIVGFTLIRDNQ